MAHDGPSLVAVLGFYNKDEAAFGRFFDDPMAPVLARKFDVFIGAQRHMIFRRHPLYRSASLSTP